MRCTLIFLAVMTLSRCATQHQPRAFPPYFSYQSESIYAPKHVYETRELERLPSLSAHQKKRLVDIYTLEYSSSRSEARKAEIKIRLDELRSEISAIEHRVRELQEKNRRQNQPQGRKEDDAFHEAESRTRYQEAHALWNKDQNDEALIVLRGLKEGVLSDPGLLKVEYLYFRIHLEKGDLPTAEESLDRVRDIDDCSFEATNGGLLTSLHHFGTGNTQQARRVFEQICDDDRSLGNLTRRSYWLARFTEDETERKERLIQLASSAVPDYYALMARYHLGQELEISGPSPVTRPYLTAPLSVSREVDSLLADAEASLTCGLRRDASVYLSRAAQIVRDDEDSDDVALALYLAHLFQAAGNHLEAMKVFNWLPTIAENESAVWLGHPDLIRDMFPRPFQHRVEWLCSSWQVDPDLVYSLMRQESAFNPTAVSSADARGLMQLMPFLAKFLAKQWRYDRYQPKNLLTAEENLKLAVFHLHQLQSLMPHVVLVAGSYNAGVARTTNWWRRYGKYPLDVFIELVPILETRNYMKYVLRNYAYYKGQRHGNANLALQWSMQLPAIPGDLPLPPPEEAQIESPQGNP